MNSNRVPQSWPAKFRSAFSGLAYAVGDQNSFYVHLPVASVVLIAAIILDLDWVRISVLMLCIGLVLVAELLNTSIEYLARAITDQIDDRIRIALDVASAAVLVAALMAVVVGAILFVPAIISRI